jgi:hypothetical protein
MSRAIFAASSIFALAALVVHRAVLAGPFVEPALLVTMGSFFLLAARVVRNQQRGEQRAQPQKRPAPAREQQRASA